MVDSTSLQNENSYLKEQLQKANESIKSLEITEKTNLELIQKVSSLEESVKWEINSNLKLALTGVY